MGRLYSATTTLQDSSTADGNGTVIPVEGFSVVGLQVVISNTATVYFEATIDGSNWVAIEGQNANSGAKATSTAASGLFVIPVGGLGHFRARSDWTSGTVIAKAIASVAEPGGAAADVQLSAGETHIGEVGGADVTITVTPTVTLTAYEANDAVGTELTFANAARTSGAGGIIKSVMFIDDAGEDEEFELWLFDTTFTDGTDAATWGSTEAELHTLAAVISTTDGTWVSGGTPSVCDVEVSRGYTCTGTSLFGQLVTRGTPDFVATDDFTVRISLVQN